MKKVILIMALVVFCFQGVSYSWEVFDSAAGVLEENLEDGSILGFGVLLPERLYKGVDDNPIPVPIMVFEVNQFFIDTTVFGYYFNKPSESLRFGIIGSPRFGGYEAGDSTDLTGMENRDWSLNAGLSTKWKNGIFDLNIDAVTDVSQTSRGQEVQMNISKVLFDGLLMPRAGIKWESKDLVDYYYGVKAGEATVSRSEYAPSSELEYMVGLTMGIPLGEKWALIGDVQVSFLGSEVKNSPIVDEGTLSRYTLGIVYRF